MILPTTTGRSAPTPTTAGGVMAAATPPACSLTKPATQAGLTGTNSLPCSNAESQPTTRPVLSSASAPAGSAACKSLDGWRLLWCRSCRLDGEGEGLPHREHLDGVAGNRWLHLTADPWDVHSASTAHTNEARHTPVRTLWITCHRWSSAISWVGSSTRASSGSARFARSKYNR